MKANPARNVYGRLDLVALPDKFRTTRYTYERKPNIAYFPPAALDLFGSPPTVSLCDGFPILLVGTASLKDLNERIKKTDPKHEPLTMDRFRANIVVETTVPYIEDTWRVLDINGIIYHVLKGCPRCKQSCTDQESGVLDVEPERTLKTYRCMSKKNPTDVFFGQNVTCMGNGEIKDGDEVRVLEVEQRFIADKGSVRAE